MTLALDPSPPSREALLAELLPSSLRRQPIRRASWTFWRTVLLGLPTAAVLPLLVLPKKFARQVGHEQQQFERLSELVMLLSRGDEAQWIARAAGDMKASRLLRYLMLLCAAVGAAGLGLALSRSAESAGGVLSFFTRPPGADDRAAVVHLGAVTIGLLLLLLEIARQAQRLSRVAHAVDLLCDRYGVRRIKPPRAGFLAEPGWLLMAGVLAWVGMLWAVPLMLAVGGHRRYTKGVSGPYRKRLAGVVKELRDSARPAAPVAPTRENPSGRCGDPNCGGPVPLGARFCPRCGQAS